MDDIEYPMQPTSLAQPEAGQAVEPIRLAYARTPAVQSDRAERVWLALLAVLFYVAVGSTLVVPPFGSSCDGAKPDLTKVCIMDLAAALDRFRSDLGRYPTTREGLEALLSPPADARATAIWQAPYIKRLMLRDAWGAPYSYKCPGASKHRAFDIASAGKNGMFGDSDDISMDDE